MPAVRQNTQATSWEGRKPAGTSIPIAQFYIAKPGTTAAEFNAALAQGKHLLITPGVYQLDDSIKVTRPNTVVLGLGYATLQPNNGVVAIDVADVDGVHLAGLLVQAGATVSDALVQLALPGAMATTGPTRAPCTTCSCGSAATASASRSRRSWSTAAT